MAPTTSQARTAPAADSAIPAPPPGASSSSLGTVIATHSTPLKPTSSSISTTDRRQHQLKELLKVELSGATYEEDDFIARWFPKMRSPLQEALVEAILTKLRTADLSHDALRFQNHPFDVSKHFEPWPIGKSEPVYYEPFAWLLNTILALAKEHRASSGVRRRIPGKKAMRGKQAQVDLATPPLHRDLQFYNHGLEMKEGLDHSHPLKPDVIGLHGSTEGERKVSWRDVEVAIEVKGAWPDLIAQGATYARCLFAARESRHFVLLIAFNHKSSEIRFCFFRRDGLWASPVLNLCQAEGFETFVRGVAGILSWETLSDAGMDMYRSDRQFFIADQRLNIVQVLCDRRCVRGRATRVYKIKTAPAPTKSTTEQEPSVDSSSVSRDDAPKPAEQPRYRYNLRPRSRTQPPSARTARFGVAPPSLPRSAGPPNPLPSLLAQMGSLALSPLHSVERDLGGDPRLLTRKPRSGNPPPLIEGSSSPPAETSSIDPPTGAGIPKWYFESRTDDWETSRLRRALPSEADDVPLDGPEIQDYWKLEATPLSELQAHQYVIIKESWLTKRHLNEAKMFMRVQGSFGVPHVLCEQQYGLADEAPRAKYWPVWSKETSATVPEQRCLSRIIYLTEGHDITELESPRKVLEVILHAMLGHWVLFKAGWLHRDVSVTNIMAIEGENRLAVHDFAVSRNITRCAGMITDGDLAIEWTDDKRFLADHRSGTLPFMAVRLLQEWDSMQRPAPKFTHTAIDDLESFLWVLFWVSLQRHHRQRDELPSPEDRWWSTLNSDDVRTQSLKDSIIKSLKMHHKAGDAGLGPIKLFAKLILEWGELADDAQSAVHLALMKEPARLNVDFHEGFYEQYLTIGFRHLENMPDSWED